MTERTLMKSFAALALAPTDLLGGLLDKDTSARVRGALVVVLCVLGGWFAKDYFGNNLTKGDIVDIVVTQRVQQQLIESSLREQCRQDGTPAQQCERRINELVDRVEARVLGDLNGDGS